MQKIIPTQQHKHFFFFIIITTSPLHRLLLLIQRQRRQRRHHHPWGVAWTSSARLPTTPDQSNSNQDTEFYII